jgi:hypothetical protein
MFQLITSFANLLRGAGIRVSPDEVMSAFKSMSHIDLASRSQFKQLLKTTLIKRISDIDLFEKIFELHFGLLSLPNEHAAPLFPEATLADAVMEAVKRNQDSLTGAFKEFLEGGLKIPLSRFAFVQGNINWEKLRYMTQTGQFLQSTRQALEMNDWDTQTASLREMLEEQGTAAMDIGTIEARITERISQLDTLLRNHILGQASLRIQSKKINQTDDKSLKRPFAVLSPYEIPRMQQTVRQLARKLRDELGLRWKRTQNGRFNLKRTMRLSLAHGGIPLQIAMRKRSKTKNRIVVLCDVSSSVRNASRFMLHLLYELQDQFGKVKSFIFVDRLVETTELFEKYDIHQAVENALNHDELPFDRYTCYGDVFKQLAEEYTDSLNRRTSLIIIGDARNNLLESGETHLEKIRARARRVFWINPEAIRLWDTGDSMMYLYRRYCDEVHSIRNLSQLIEFVNRIRL